MVRIPWMGLSDVFGSLSIVIWLCAQLPQIYTNYRNRSVEGLSLSFLMIWMLGDTSGLVGCILTGQLGFQTVLSCYYVCMDIVLGFQYYLYTRPVLMEGVSATYYDENVDNSNRRDSRGSKPLSIRGKRLSSFVSMSTLAGSIGQSSASPIAANSASVLALAMKHAAPGTTVASWNAGYVCAYLSMLMYVSSRMPQISLNYRRRSTDGVSKMLFSATLCGNLFYSTSILCAAAAMGPEAKPFLLNELSYIIGSAGTVLFDVVILIQMYVYRRANPGILGEDATAAASASSSVMQNSELQQLRAKVARSKSSTALLLSHQSIYSSVEVDDDRAR